MSYKIFDEKSGVYSAVLIEDMVKTMVATGRTFINCKIEDFYDVKFDYPLVYVPTHFQSLPLYEGDEVIIYFNQNKLLYPVLWKVLTPYTEDEMKNKVVDKFDGSDVTFLQKLCPEAFIYCTKAGFALNVDGTILLQSNPKASKPIYLNGKDEPFVTWTAFKDAINSLIDQFNSHTHQVSGVDSGSSSVVSGSPVSPASEDLNPCKSKYVFTSK